MTEQRGPEYRIRYYTHMIVLEGKQATIQKEAHKILNRFAASACPYKLNHEAGGSITLVPKR